ncbi:MAG: N-acyl-D-amino-acid deacylase family protein [Burkholderiales bacterium]
MLDYLIRGGSLVDGSGATRRTADLGIKDGRIVAIGKLNEGARRTINADGLIVSPGFVDGHTHMDAQVMWDPLGSCSCFHGVTSVVMSNCGFTLSPCKAQDRDWYARSLSYVEDISVDAMREGIDWTWESFAEYQDAVRRRPKALNHAMYIGHSAVRMYVMGARALSSEASDDEIAQMTSLVIDAIRSGAVGFSSSRSHTHLAPDGNPVASRIAHWREIEAIVAAMGRLGKGIFQIGPDILNRSSNQKFLEHMKHFALSHKVPVMFGVISTKQGDDPPRWQDQLETIQAVNLAGGRMFGQASTRSINAIFSLKSYLPFDVLDAWKPIRALPLPMQLEALRQPSLRQELIAAESLMKPRDNKLQGGGAATTDARKPDYDNLYVMRDVDWQDKTVGELAVESGKHPVDLMIELCLTNNDQIFVQPIVNESREDLKTLLGHEQILATFSDSGAHVAQEMGSSLQTHFLHYWVNQAKAFTLEAAVKKLSHDNARAFGLAQRGMLKEGYWADILLFEEERIRPCVPVVENDLPAGARRLVQKAEGIRRVFVNGAESFIDGESTGQYAGGLLSSQSK